MCYVGVILTGSRGGYLSVLMSLFVFAALSLRAARAAGSVLRSRIAAGAVAMIVLAALAVFLVIHKSDFLSDRTRTVINKNIRLDFWRAALEQWKLNPLVGTGSSTYLFYGRQFRTDAVQMDPVYVHNDYLQLLSEYGLAGLTTFLLFLLFHVRRGLIMARRLGPRRIAATQRLPSNTLALNLGALGAVGAYGVHSAFDFNLHIPANVLLVAFVFGILANSGVEQNSEAGRPHRWELLAGKALLAALAFTLALQIWRLAPGEFYAEKARTALRDHRPLAGLSFALRGLQFERKNPQLYYYLGRSRVLMGDMQAAEFAQHSFYEAALPAYESARRLAPMDETYWLELAFTLDSLKRFAEAEWMFDEAIQMDPRSRAIRYYYQAHLDRWSEASIKAGHVEGGPSD
jgi:tetratricopeptide (TPR) repeat protein